MANDCRVSLRTRLCFVCLQPVLDRQGLWHTAYNILLHRGACSALVTQQERIYDRSKRGRWRPKSQVLAHLRAQRPQSATRKEVPDAS